MLSYQKIYQWEQHMRQYLVKPVYQIPFFEKIVAIIILKTSMEGHAALPNKKFLEGLKRNNLSYKIGYNLIHHQ